MHAETLLKMINSLLICFFFLWNLDYFGEVIPLAGMVIEPQGVPPINESCPSTPKWESL